MNINKLIAEACEELQETKPFSSPPPGEKFKNFLMVYPIIYKLRNQGASWVQVAEYIKSKLQFDFSAIYLCDTTRKLNKRFFMKKLQGLIVLSPIKTIPEYLLNSAIDSHLGFKVVPVSNQALNYAIEQDELMEIENLVGRLIIKRIMYWYHISDSFLIENNITPAFELILDTIEDRFQNEYYKLSGKVKSDSNLNRRNKK